ncbi:DsbA family oxidoreductase [Exiguobacterium flavidum]|uniref:DsbA family oxidoreductase n=1 Tax=Exiguobacterium flavidum TaxID=2184695 RepID=UPI001E2FB074|nr:DsbA family oxidoreductase [Exiguobacterium flavidum]
MMKIEIWSDYACPFCFIGKRRLESALAELDMKNQVDIEWKSFELDPNAPAKIEESMDELLASKYGMTVEQAKGMSAQVAQTAATDGLNYRMDAIKPANTFNAHRLTHHALTEGVELSETLFRAYFEQGENLNDSETLLRLAKEAGLSPEKTAEVLAGDAFAEAVRKDESEASEIGVQGVPFFVFDRKYAVSGAQPVEAFVQVIEKRLAEQETDKPQLLSSADACGTDGCTF